MQCRVCMQTNCQILLDMSIACTDDGKSLFDYYNECTQLRASVSDNFPKTLCKVCTQKLQIAYTFRKCARQSHEEFKKLLTSQTMETELVLFSAEEFSAFKKLEETTDDPLEMGFKQAVKALTKPDFEYPGHVFCVKQYSHQYFEEPPKEMQKYRKADGTIKTENEAGLVIEFLSEISNDQSQLVTAQKSGNEESEEESETDTKQHESELPMHWEYCNEKPLMSRNKLDNFQSNNKSHKYFPSASYNCKYWRDIYSSDFELEKHVKKHGIFKTHINQKYNNVIVKQLPEKESDNISHTESSTGYVQKKGKESELHKRIGTKGGPNQKETTENNLHTRFADDNQDQQKSSEMCVDKRTDSSKLKEEKRHLCSFCPRVLSTRLALNAHEKKQHLNIQTDLKECPTCQKKFSSDYLKKHIQVVHIGERKFTCDICGDSYKSHPQLSRHKLLHKKERNLACTVCDKRFTETSHFKVHMRIHTGELPFACQFCDRRFRIKVHLTYHLQHHANIKQKCNICDKEFKNIKSLRDHSYLHTGVMPYFCVICGYGSPKREYFTKHMLRKHGTTMTADELFAMFKANTGRSPHVKLVEELDTMYKNVQQST